MNFFLVITEFYDQKLVKCTYSYDFGVCHIIVRIDFKQN